MLTHTVIERIDLLRLEHGKANALDLELIRAIREALASEATGEGPIVLTGAGSIFCAGVDLFRVVEGGRTYIEQFLPALDGLFFDLLRFPRPLVAAINGHAIAGGCLLACACDYRVLVDGGARVGLPELNVGVAFPASAIEVLRGVVGSARLPELLYFGRTYDPPDAARHGLVDEIVPADALLRRAVEVARELAARPARSFGVTKTFLRAGALERMRAASAELPALIEAWASEETIAAVRSYLEKTLKR